MTRHIYPGEAAFIFQEAKKNNRLAVFTLKLREIDIFIVLRVYTCLNLEGGFVINDM